jgi:hypothetical protein
MCFYHAIYGIIEPIKIKNNGSLNLGIANYLFIFAMKNIERIRTVTVALIA